MGPPAELLVTLNSQAPEKSDEGWRLFFRPMRPIDANQTGTSLSIAYTPTGYQLQSVQRPCPERRACISMGWVDAGNISAITTQASRQVGSAPWYEWTPSLFVFVVLGFVEGERLIVQPPQGAGGGGGGQGQGGFGQAKTRLETYKGRIQIYKERSALGRAAQGQQGRRGSAPPSPGMRGPHLGGPRSPGMGGGIGMGGGVRR